MWSKADRSVVLATGAVLAVGLAGTWLVVSWTGPRPRPPGHDLVEVLVVRQDLPVLTLLDDSAIRSHLDHARVRRDRLPAGAVGDERLVLGKWVNRTLRAGEYLTDADVGRPGCTMSVPDAFRAMCVQLGPDDRSAGTLKPGGHVDLFVGVRVSGDRVASVPVVKGLLVLAVNATDHALYVAVTPAQGEAIEAEYRGDLRAVRSGGAE